MTGRIDEIVGRGSGGVKSGDGADAAARAGGVGALLRASRIRCGEDLTQVAGALRIRLAHLEAIEDGRFNDLPGPTYTLGFIRTYAGHLGLDVDEVIRRLRAETEIAAVKPDLLFPVPVSDTTMPTGAVVMIGVVAAAVAYGAYLMGSSGDRVEVAQVSPVPERMATAAGSANAQSTNAPVEAPPSSTPSSESVLAGTSESAKIEVVAGAQPATPASVPAAPTPAPAPSTPAPSATAQPSTSAPAPVSSPAAPAPAAASSLAAPASPPTSAAAAAPQIAALPQPTAAPADTPPAAPKPPRIEVRAKADSWIQVREGTAGAMLFTRLLRVGETYAAPDRSGLMLLTGNAGALEILVDGAAVPSLGPEGAVRRRIALDADRLKSGTAAAE